jgi:hypothetical protein
MKAPADNSPLSITAFDQRFVGGGGIGAMSLSVPAVFLAAGGGQDGRCPVSLAAPDRPRDSSRKIFNPAMILPFAERAQSIMTFKSAGPVRDPAAKPVTNPWAQGRAA